MGWLPKQSLVVPIDFSELSLEALALAAEFVQDASHLHLIHVLPKLSPMEPGVIWGTIDDESRAAHAHKALKERLGEGKYEGAKIEIAFGNAAHEIAEHAKSVNADLIVLPSHGRTGAAHVLIGSVAERVVRHAHCPVLILRN